MSGAFERRRSDADLVGLEGRERREFVGEDPDVTRRREGTRTPEVDMSAVEELGRFMQDSLTWRLLVLPQQPRRKSAGGIELPEDVQDAEQHLQYIGKIIAIGPLAGKSDKFLPPEYRDVNLAKRAERDALPYQWPYKAGDWVIYGQYAGMRKEYKGIKLLVVNDDELLGRIPSPEGFKVYA